MSTTAPVVDGKFAAANGDFYAESSGHNRHRRATAAELKAHFHAAGSEKDKPGHWYEAQLIHYGLPPSMTKGVAFKRLFDAVNGGGPMRVPPHIARTEVELKREWTRRDRENRRGMLDIKTKTSKTTAVRRDAAGTKRKAEDHVDLTVSVGGINVTVSANNNYNSLTQGTAKRAKTTAARTSKSTKKTNPKIKAALRPTKDAVNRSRTIPTSGRGRGPLSTAGMSRAASTILIRDQPSRPQQTARESDDEAPPPPYSEFDDRYSDYGRGNSSGDDSRSSGLGDAVSPRYDSRHSDFSDDGSSGYDSRGSPRRRGDGSSGYDSRSPRHQSRFSSSAYDGQNSGYDSKGSSGYDSPKTGYRDYNSSSDSGDY